jgi:hypothetical protein
MPTTDINDVVLTRDAAYFTESTAPFLYRVALGPGGEPSPDFEEIPLTANFGVPGGCAGFLYAVTAGFAPPAPDFVVRLLK